MLSVLVIAKNEEKDIVKCLSSVKWADELIVVDNDSIDQTVRVAKSNGAKVFSYAKSANMGHFSELREFASQKASGDWLLYLDADEEITTALKNEILEITTSSASSSAAYAIPRRNILLGREMKHGGWWPDYVLRLIKTKALLGYEGKLHEQPKIDGEVGKLENPMVHTTHTNLSEMIEKTNRWSEIEAQLLFDAKHPPMNIFRFFTAGFREFWYRAIRKMGFLDGTEGWIEIMYQVYSRLVTYSKLWERQLAK